MALPTIALAEHLTTLLPAEWSVIQGPISQLEPPAVVLRADNPWVEPSAYCHDQQQYAAVGVVTASSPADGETMLYTLIHELMDNLPEGWQFLNASAPVVDQSTGTPYLAAIIRLRYSNTESEAS